MNKRKRRDPMISFESKQYREGWDIKITTPILTSTAPVLYNFTGFLHIHYQLHFIMPICRDAASYGQNFKLCVPIYFPVSIVISTWIITVNEKKIKKLEHFPISLHQGQSQHGLMKMSDLFVFNSINNISAKVVLDKNVYSNLNNSSRKCKKSKDGLLIYLHTFSLGIYWQFDVLSVALSYIELLKLQTINMPLQSPFPNKPSIFNSKEQYKLIYCFIWKAVESWALRAWVTRLHMDTVAWRASPIATCRYKQPGSGLEAFMNWKKWVRDEGNRSSGVC